jgi:Protein of unknown function (DUF3800)
LFAYTAYLDESGTHDGSAVTVMGGVVGRADQWKQFQAGYDKAKEKHGFQVFHTKKFKKKSGDFKGWSGEKCIALWNDLGQLTASGLTDCVAIALDNETYALHYKASGVPAKVRLDSKYGLCFRMCINYFLLEMMKRKYRRKFPKLHIVLEAGNPNSGDAERIFLESKKESGSLGILQTLTLATKEDCDPLMMADFVAHSTLLLNRRAREQNRPTPQSQIVPRRMLGITHLESTPQGLANLRAMAVEWRRRNAIPSTSSLGETTFLNGRPTWISQVKRRHSAKLSLARR